MDTSKVEKAWATYIRSMVARTSKGEPLPTCTEVCQWLKRQYFPDGVIYGYHFDSNPTAKIGEAEDGHDFLVVDNTHIIDLWYKDVYDPEFPLLLPIERAPEYYGDRSKWEILPA